MVGLPGCSLHSSWPSRPLSVWPEETGCRAGSRAKSCVGYEVAPEVAENSWCSLCDRAGQNSFRGDLSSAFGWGLRSPSETPRNRSRRLEMGLGAIELRHQEVSGWVRIMVFVQQGSANTLCWWHSHAKALGHKE